MEPARRRSSPVGSVGKPPEALLVQAHDARRSLRAQVAERGSIVTKGISGVPRRLPDRSRSGLDDETLVRQSLDGQRGSFEKLVRRHQNGVVNHLFRLVGRREAAMDLAQEVFIKVYQSLETFDPRYRFTTWLYRIASNRAIDHLRRQRITTCSFHGDSTEEDSGQSGDRFAGPGPSPDEVLRYRELEFRVELALADLPTAYRELILLRHRQHCRYDEIARITGLPLGTVKNRIFRAREILRRTLADVLDAEA
jgi:RNA polymerase sigma-70 factor (ECF subfamily)